MTALSQGRPSPFHAVRPYAMAASLPLSIQKLSVLRAQLDSGTPEVNDGQGGEN